MCSELFPFFCSKKKKPGVSLHRYINISLYIFTFIYINTGMENFIQKLFEKLYMVKDAKVMVILKSYVNPAILVDLWKFLSKNAR